MKKEIIVASVIFVIAFSLGMASFKPINRAYLFTADLFGGKKDPSVYMAKPSEYEKRTDELFKSTQFQAICRAGAKAQVALEIAGEAKQKAVHYLGEFDTNSNLATKIFADSPVSIMGASASSTKDY